VLAQEFLDAVTDGGYRQVSTLPSRSGRGDRQHGGASATFVLVLILACLVALLLAATFFGWLVRFGVLLVIVPALTRH